VVASRDGDIYITDGSLNYETQKWQYDLMTKGRSGRLIRYDLNKNKAEVLLSALYYPYGLAVTHDEKWVIFTESWRHRVVAYSIKDFKPDSGKQVIINLPGYPARIVHASDGGYWMSLFAMRTHIVEFVLTEAEYRNKMVREISDPNHWIAPALSSGEDFLEPLQGGAIKQLGMIKPWAPPRSYGLVLKLNDLFEPIDSFHSRPGGKWHGITGLREIKGNLFIVSYGHNAVLQYRSNEVI
jgi:hypothetical protein